MKEIKFNDKTYSIPENWNEVTLRMVIRTSELEELIEDAPIVSIICGYSGIDDRELKLCRMPEVKPILDILDFIYTPYEPHPIHRFIFNGEEYSTRDSIEETEFGEWVSSQTILYKYRDNPVLGLSRMIAVICKKKGETLDDINLDSRAQMFMELPFTTAKDLECFFLNSRKALSVVSLLYSTIPEQQQLVLHKFNELQSLMKQRQVERGWYSPMRYVIGIYRLYLRYLKHDLERYFNTELSETSKRHWIMTYKSKLSKMFSGSIKESPR